MLPVALAALVMEPSLTAALAAVRPAQVILLDRLSSLRRETLVEWAIPLAAAAVEQGPLAVTHPATLLVLVATGQATASQDRLPPMPVVAVVERRAVGLLALVVLAVVGLALLLLVVPTARRTRAVAEEEVTHRALVVLLALAAMVAPVW